MNIIITILLKIIIVVYIIIRYYYFMCSHQCFLRSVKSNMNNNFITLSENISSSTQTHLQTQNADTIPVSSPSILPTTSSQVSSTPLSSSNSSHQSLLQNNQPPTILIQNSPQLQFDPSHIDIFFHTFDAHYFGKHLTEKQLYFELIKCFSSEHLHKASLCMSRDIVNSYTRLKAALIKVCSLPLHKRLTQLRNAPPLGDRSPHNYYMTVVLKLVGGTEPSKFHAGPHRTLP